MMKYFTYIIFSLLLLMPFGLDAETVSQKEASHIAQLFFNEAKGEVMQKPKLVWTGRKLTTNSLFNPYYVYNNPVGGFVIISAENKAFPVLAFSLKENFNPDKLNQKERTLLKQYATDIENIRYDSSFTDLAINAWNDIPGYIHRLLCEESDFTYETDIIPFEEAENSLKRVIETEKDEFFADIYTPAQWESIISEEYSKVRNVPLALIEGKEIIPLIVSGRKGDYYRLELDSHKNWLMRLTATEVLSPDQVAVLGNPPLPPKEEDNETPFRFYEDFIAETAASQQTAIENSRLPLTPTIQSHGGGHFQITTPEDVILARVFSLSGRMIQEHYFSGTPAAFINLEAAPSGFYVALILTESGKPYSFKLYR